MNTLSKILMMIMALTIFMSCQVEGTNNVEPKSEVLEFEGNFEDFLLFLQKISNENKQEAVDLYIGQLSSAPIIENNMVYFIYLTDKENVSVAGDFNEWNDNVHYMAVVSETTLMYINLEFEMNARLDYKFVADGSWFLDPLNPNQVSGGFGPNSELAMPEYVQPWEINDLDNPSGEVISTQISSSIMGETYDLEIYLPYDFNPDLNYPSLYIQDGSEYLDLGSANLVLDNLIATKAIEPVIAVFISPNDRSVDYAFERRYPYALFFVEELVPFVDSNYSTIQLGNKRTVMGASFGGNISALICYKYPEVFSNLGLHSGAFWPNDHELTNMITSGAMTDVKIASIWGTYEPSIAYDMNIVKDYMLANDEQIFWMELPEGHSWGLWRASFDDILKYFYSG